MTSSIVLPDALIEAPFENGLEPHVTSNCRFYRGRTLADRTQASPCKQP